MPCSRFNAFHLFNSLKLARLPACSLLPSSLYLDRSHCLVLAPATLAALPSTRAIPDRDVFYVARPTRSILLSSSFLLLCFSNFLIPTSSFLLSLALR